MSNPSTPDSRYGISALLGRQNWARLAAIGFVLLCSLGLFAYVGGWFSPGLVTPARMIDAFEQADGPHPGFRRNHAKGVCIAGSFESNGRGVRLSKAQVFQAGRTAVIGRFALAGGQPFQADAPKTVRSMALSFRPLGGEEWRTGMNDIPVFPLKDSDAFYEQILVSAPDPATGKPDPAKSKAFLDAHPETARALALIVAAPTSSGFIDASYNSLNAFRFINDAGVSTPVRWSMAAVEPFAQEKPDQAASADKNYLFDAAIDRLQHGPAQWRLIVTIGHPGDPTNDATVAWPDDRERVDVGTLTIDHIEAEAAGNCRDVNFDPLVLPSGIEPSDDPLLSARSAAYSQSFTRRAGETKVPSAVSAPAAGKGS